MKVGQVLVLILFSFIVLGAYGAENAPDLVEDVSRYLSQDALGGRRKGTEGNRLASRYLIAKMQELGLEPAGENGTYLDSSSGGNNLLGILRPEFPAGTSEVHPTVMLGAHYDHIDDCHHEKLSKSKVCNGASDNAAAVAAVLGAVQKLKGKISSPIAIALWDGEEEGLTGSWHFAKHPTFDLSNLHLYINLDIIGLNLFRGFESHSFVVGAETGGPALKSDVDEAAKGEPVKYHHLSYGFGHYRSDMTTFVLQGRKLPIAFFTDGDGKVYHTSADEFEFLNLTKVRSVSSVIAKLALISSTPDKSYAYQAPLIHLKVNTPAGFILWPFLMQRNGISLPLYEDIGTVQRLTEEVAKIGEQNGFSPKTIEDLLKKSESLKELAEAGPESFGVLDSYNLASSAQHVLDLARGLDFIP